MIRRLQTSTMIVICFMASSATIAYFFLLPPQIPLFYSLVKLEDQLANKAFIFLFPLLALLFGIMHYIFKKFPEIENTATEMFAFVTLSCVILLFIAMMRIVLLVS